ncbi:hypothetical protein AK812_SmicGene40029 [Symbiodinium microadriaticum]|uniref:Uncharacterized protein n=1 Tax=Symbiodinium microadriaticum TaxID=2951 RepID=A0A1Q9C9R5_SYMMI|nr:hypothetical protein AK812_SmicGene40029 [Symbiodinium microadriaticum]
MALRWLGLGLAALGALLLLRAARRRSETAGSRGAQREAPLPSPREKRKPIADDEESALACAHTEEEGLEDRLSTGDEPTRPSTTAVVARRMIFSHLGLRLSEEQKAEERAFWKQRGRRTRG